MKIKAFIVDDEENSRIVLRNMVSIRATTSCL